MLHAERAFPSHRGRALAARLRALAACACVAAAIAAPQGATAGTTFTVTSTADSGVGSLRDAIVQANTTVQPAPYTINFNINTATDPGCIGSPKVCTIMPATDLPPILRQTTIDGYTQPGASPSTAAFGDPTNAAIVLVLDGSGSVPGTNGFAMASTVNTLVRGFSVVGWHNGFNFTGGGEFGFGQISGNYIGLLPDGITMKPNTDTGILGNGTGALYVGSPEGGLVMPGDRNVIASSTRGIYQTTDFFILVYGNYIGTDASGTFARPNGDGIVIAASLQASNSTLSFNVVSGNTNHGYLIAAGHELDITNTRVGTTAPGTAALPNGYGITFTQGAGAIGKSFASDPGNIVSGNTHDGITFAAGTGGIFNPQLVLYTLVGTDINLNPLGNGGAGIVANGSAIVIGGFGGGTAGSNTIAHNGGDGIDIADAAASGVNVGANSIYANAGLGISFRPGMGPTPNDPGDTDTGPNGLQNHPVLTSASVSSGSVTIGASLNSEPSMSYTILYFGNDTCDPSGFGEGKTYLGFRGIDTDASGNGSILATLPVPAGVAIFTALVTRGTNPSSSSEFSNCISAGAPPVLQSVASRKVHGAAGTFDLPLSLVVSNPTTEPRLGPAQTIVFTFDKPITAAAAFITEGVATAGAPSFSGNSVIVPLTGVNNEQYVSVLLSNVMSSDGGTATAVARIGFLAGDVNQNRVVTLADLAFVNAQLTQPVTAANFLKDINASGTLTLADKALANANLTKALPPP